MSSKTSSNTTEISFGLTGRVCIVTGGAPGIGEACIRRFARENAKVVIADIDDVRGSALASELGGLFDHCDVGDKAQVDALLSQTIAAHGRIDVLVNNAGIFKAADFLDISEDDFDAVLRINLKGSFLVGQAVARAMSKAEVREGIGGSPSRGCIINMRSVNAAAPRHHRHRTRSQSRADQRRSESKNHEPHADETPRPAVRDCGHRGLSRQ